MPRVALASLNPDLEFEVVGDDEYGGALMGTKRLMGTTRNARCVCVCLRFRWLTRAVCVCGCADDVAWGAAMSDDEEDDDSDDD